MLCELAYVAPEPQTCLRWISRQMVNSPAAHTQQDIECHVTLDSFRTGWTWSHLSKWSRRCPKWRCGCCCAEGRLSRLTLPKRCSHMQLGQRALARAAIGTSRRDDDRGRKQFWGVGASGQIDCGQDILELETQLLGQLAPLPNPKLLILRKHVCRKTWQSVSLCNLSN